MMPHPPKNTFANTVFTAATPRWYELLIGGIFVVTAIFFNQHFMGLAVTGLNIGLIIAYLMWVLAGSQADPEQNRVGSIYLLAIAVQCLHFGEEYLMDFHIQFPGLFGYRWSDELFVIFNLIWLFIFVLAAWGVFHRIRLSYLVIWFFALVVGLGNGIGHPVLSIAQGGYFPGLITSLGHLFIGVLLIKELVKAKQPADFSPP